MSKQQKTLFAVLHGKADANIGFSEICALLTWLGFHQRVRGSHHIFWKSDVVEILNLQPKKGKAKPYQAKQVRQVIIKYHLGDIIQ